MPPDLLFYAMLAFLFTHELDAVKRHEWRVLPLTSFLPDVTGERVFIWLHVPLFFAILWGVRDDPNQTFGQFLSAFSVVHIGLHWLFRNHPRYEFNTVGAWSLILAAGFFGGLHLIAVHA